MRDFQQRIHILEIHLPEFEDLDMIRRMQRCKVQIWDQRSEEQEIGRVSVHLVPGSLSSRIAEVVGVVFTIAVGLVFV